MNKNMKCRIILKLCLMIILPSSFNSGLRAGEPCTHLLVCCQHCNREVKILINGKWTEKHTYASLDACRDILQKIKDVGINTVIVDMTNRAQWLGAFEKFYRAKIDTIQQVCEEKDMQFFIHIGHSWSKGGTHFLGLPAETSHFEAWGEIAQIIWDNWAQKPTYKKYGYGDDRPILNVFTSGKGFWKKYAALSNKRGYPNFRIGTMWTNHNHTGKVVESDGWGYRHSIGNPSGTVRYTSPNSNWLPNAPKLPPELFAAEVEWAKQASHYSVYGSYDDTCDGILWGIADTSTTANPYPNDGSNPWIYYDILKAILRDDH